MSGLIITQIRNPFDPMKSRVIKEVEAGLTVREYIDMMEPCSEGYELVISLNGRPLDENSDLPSIRAAGSLVFCSSPRGSSGGGGKNIWRTVAMLAVVVIAAVVSYGVATGPAAAAWGAGSAAAYAAGAAAGMAVSLVGNLLVNALLPLSTPDLSGSSDIEKSSTYGWEVGTNSNSEGVAWPVIYGKCRIVPPIIAKYIEVVDDKQYLNILYALADHTISSIDENSVRIAESSVAKGVNGVDWEYRLGTNDQTCIQYFNDTRLATAVGAKLSIQPVWTAETSYVPGDIVSYSGDLTVYKCKSGNTGKAPDGEEGSTYWEVWPEHPWTEVDVDGSAVEGLAVAISLPRGLFKVNTSNGQLEEYSVELDIQYKRVKDADGNPVSEPWVPRVGKNETPTWTVSRWSAGYLHQTAGWVELEAGSEVFTDHVDGETYTPSSSGGEWTYYSGFGFGSAPEGRPVYCWKWLTAAPANGAVGSVTMDHVEITGNKSTPIRRVYTRDNFPAAEIGEYKVRVRFHGSAVPSQSTQYGSDVWIDYIETIVYDNFTYPGTALFALRALATDRYSGSIPKVDLVITRETVPVWTGAAYENKPAGNPAWASYDIIHNSFYGGGIPYSRIIYEDFLSWAYFCESKEFACGIYFDTIFTLRKALDMLGILGRGNTVQMGSKFTCFCDKEVEIPSQIFNVGNIGSGSLSIEYLEMDNRANAIEVTYWDSTNYYEKKMIEVHAIDFDSTTEEVKKNQLTLIGCTTREHALKLGYYAMNCNRLLTTTASWLADIDSIGCVPWDVVEVQHDVTYWGEGGRTVSSTQNTITIDKEISLEKYNDDGELNVYTLKVTDAITGDIATYTLAPLDGDITTSVLTITGSFNPWPALYDLWVLTVSGKETKLMRITKIGRQDDLTRKIVAVEYSEDVYVDDGTLQPPEGPGEIEFTAHLKAEEIKSSKESGESRIHLTWTGFATLWHVFQKKSGESSWAYLGPTGYPFYIVSNIDYGVEYTFAVSHTMDPEEDGQVVTITPGGGPFQGPDTPLDFTLSVVDDKILLAWNSTTDTKATAFNINLEYNDGESVKVVENFHGNQYLYTENLTAGTYKFFLTRTVEGEDTESIVDDTIVIEGPSTPSPYGSANGETAYIEWQDCKTSLTISKYIVNGASDVLDRHYVTAVTWEGLKAFSIVAVDVAGNQSAAGSVSIPVEGEGTETHAVTSIMCIGKVESILLMLQYTTWAKFQAVEIHASESNDRNTAVKVGETTGSTFLHKGLDLIDRRFYWTKIRDVEGVYGYWYPFGQYDGVVGDTSTDPGDYMDPGTIDESGLSATLASRIAWIDQYPFVFSGDYVYPDVVSGMAGVFNVLSSLLTSHDGRIAAAEININEGIAGVWASISLLATTAALDGAVARISLAEQNISAGIAGTWAQISSRATTAQLTALDTKVSSVESTLTAGLAGVSAELVNRVTTATYNADQKTGGLLRISLAESRLTAAEAGVSALETTRLLVATYNADQKDGNGYSRLAALENRFAVFDQTDCADWNSWTTYHPGDFVKYLYLYYRCTKVSLNNIPNQTVGVYWANTSGLVSEWTLKLNANNQVAGVGLTLDATYGSDFVILSDRFKIMPSSGTTPTDGGSARAVFAVNTVTKTVYISGDLILDGSLIADKIATGSLKGASITLVRDSSRPYLNSAIQGGAKTDFTTSGAGFILGIHHADNIAKFYIGNTTKYIVWDGYNLYVGGDVIATGNIQQGAVNTGNINPHAVTNSWLSWGVSSEISLSITSTGGALIAFANFCAIGDTGYNFYVKVYRDGVTLYAQYGPTGPYTPFHAVSVNWVGLPAGNYTFRAGGTGVVQVFLTVLELKR